MTGTPGEIRQLSLKSAADEKFPGGAFGTYLQRAGVNLFLWVLGFTLLICIALFAYLLWKTPGLPNLTGSGTMPDSNYVRIVVEQRAQVYSNFLEGVSRLVLNLCLPLLTAILGYLFGQRR